MTTPTEDRGGASGERAYDCANDHHCWLTARGERRHTCGLCGADAIGVIDRLRAAPPSGLTPPRPQVAAIAEYSAEEIRRLASIREALIEAAKTRSNYGHPWCNVCNRRWEEHSSACVVTRGLGDLAWLLARLDAPRESSAVAAPEGPTSPVAGAPEGNNG